MAKRKRKEHDSEEDRDASRVDGAVVDVDDAHEAVADGSVPQPESIEIPFKNKTIHCEKRGTDSIQLIFTHGAGGTLDNPAIKDFAVGFSRAAAITCFKGNMNLKSRTAAFEAVIEDQDFSKALGGRSMGARAAVMAKSDDTQALVLVSYPLIGEKNRRDDILLDLTDKHDVLFIIGDNDKMCPVEDIEKLRNDMTARTWLIVVEGADHGMNTKPKAATQPLCARSGLLAAEWLRMRDPKRTRMSLRWRNDQVEADEWQ